MEKFPKLLVLAIFFRERGWCSRLRYKNCKISTLIACHVRSCCAQLCSLKTYRDRIPVGPVLFTCSLVARDVTIIAEKIVDLELC